MKEFFGVRLRQYHDTGRIEKRFSKILRPEKPEDRAIENVWYIDYINWFYTEREAFEYMRNQKVA